MRARRAGVTDPCIVVVGVLARTGRARVVSTKVSVVTLRATRAIDICKVQFWHTGRTDTLVDGFIIFLACAGITPIATIVGPTRRHVATLVGAVWRRITSVSARSRVAHRPIPPCTRCIALAPCLRANERTFVRACRSWAVTTDPELVTPSLAKVGLARCKFALSHAVNRRRTNYRTSLSKCSPRPTQYHHDEKRREDAKNTT